ncbi:MAG: flippase-like domain-containing protein [Phycisphaerae bacterium]|nr:flippase-like domain-containing protein [Phycisphaerae bacterium]
MSEPNSPTNAEDLFEDPPPRTRRPRTPGAVESLPRTTPSAGRAVLQIVGFLIGLSILAWCISAALSPENRDKLHALSRAPAGLVALLFALSAVSLALNGAMFWTTLLPAKRLPMADVQAVNAAAALLSYLPFKLSIVARFLIHNRRNGVPLLTIGAWLAAVAAVLVATMTPTAAAAAWRQQADTVFALVCVAGMALAYAAVLGGASLFAHEQGLERLHRWAAPLGFSWLDRALRSTWFRRVHVALDMLAHPGTLALSMLLRVADLSVQAARFSVAAACLGTSLEFGVAFLTASMFFLIGVLSPSGALGAREGASTGLAALLAVPGLSGTAFAPIALTVSASEVLVNLTCAVVGGAYLRVTHRTQP